MTTIEVTPEGYEKQKGVVAERHAAWKFAQATPQSLIEQDGQPACPDSTLVDAFRASYEDAARRLDSMQIVDVVDSSCVAVGSFVIVEIDGEYTTVRIDGCVHSDDTKGVENITVDSPLGRALLNCRVGAEVTYVVDSGRCPTPLTAHICKIWREQASLAS